ncbi:hypothetical protein EJ05DRAFT_475609 [Pseudovirgaria hyperparasitica]|uniref:Uncharacterized protein n=1 Tax=Pseudovirgaria hyperparasitica TaxID=470096 RepID=A0A6A6WC22_9PEZI|nr:uncharacterized protein EJ05DRAFT_475609 [Pseudovirgaria hyperparasitica]KAF2759396.1 hypothetical protein EJ05DRAFT_475609 [Pseudovirgaria hyperparasitica]
MRLFCRSRVRAARPLFFIFFSIYFFFFQAQKARRPDIVSMQDVLMAMSALT